MNRTPHPVHLPEGGRVIFPCSICSAVHLLIFCRVLQLYLCFSQFFSWHSDLNAQMVKISFQHRCLGKRCHTSNSGRIYSLSI